MGPVVKRPAPADRFVTYLNHMMPLIVALGATFERIPPGARERYQHALRVAKLAHRAMIKRQATGPEYDALLERIEHSNRMLREFEERDGAEEACMRLVKALAEPKPSLGELREEAYRRVRVGGDMIRRGAEEPDMQADHIIKVFWFKDPSLGAKFEEHRDLLVAALVEAAAIRPGPGSRSRHAGTDSKHPAGDRLFKRLGIYASEDTRKSFRRDRKRRPPR